MNKNIKIILLLIFTLLTNCGLFKKYEVIWKYSIEYSHIIPVVCDNTIIRGNVDYFEAININDGTRLWRNAPFGKIKDEQLRKSFGKLNRTICVHNSAIYYVVGHYLFSDFIDASRGRWVFQSYDDICVPLISEDRVYFGSGNFLYSISDITGKEIWKFKANGQVKSAPISYDNSIIFSLNKDIYSGICSIGRDSSNINWCYQTDKGIKNLVKSEKSLYCPTIYFATTKSLIALDIKTGTEIWRKDFDFEIISYLSLIDSKLIFNIKKPSLTHVFLIAFDVGSNKILWEIKRTIGISSKFHPEIGLPTSYNSLLFFTNFDDLWAVDVNTGKLKWKFDDWRKEEEWGHHITSNPVIKDNIVYVENTFNYSWAIEIK